VSSGIGGWLYTIAPRLPFWVGVPFAAARVGTVAAMRELPVTPPPGRVAHLAHAGHIVRHALVDHPRLRSAMALSVALGMSTFAAVWLIQPWMRGQGIPPAWFGPLWAAAHLWLAGVSLVSARVAARLGLTWTLLGCALLPGISYVGLGLSTSAAGFVFYLGFMVVRGLQGPLLAAVLQADAPAEDRASVLSLNTLLFRLTSVVALPPSARWRTVSASRPYSCCWGPRRRWWRSEHGGPSRGRMARRRWAERPRHGRAGVVSYRADSG
jgi:hypothetical protein